MTDPQIAAQISLPEDVDVVDLEIFSKALQHIATEMGIVMMRTSGNPVIAEAVDFSTFIAGADGDIAAYAGYITIYLGPARAAVRHLLATVPRADIHPGDAYLCNDPYTTGASHAPDVAVVRPLFADGELVAWCWAESHMYDVGGMAPGGFAPMAQECYGEGLRFPGIKIVDRGRLVDDVVRLIETNVRVPMAVLNDIRCLVAACNRGEERFAELVDHYGVDTFRRYVRLGQSQAELAMRARIATLPEGRFEAEEYIEHNGHANDLYRVHCVATVAAGHLTLDFSGSSPQTDGFVNCSAACTLGMAVTVPLMTLAPDLPINEGSIRAIDVITVPGTVCHVTMPAPSSSGHMEAGLRVMKVVQQLMAMLQAASTDAFVTDHVMAPWHDCWPGAVFYAPHESGELVPFLDMHGGSGGGGAQPVSDGIDVAATLCQVQNSVPDVEINEAANPVLYLWRRINAGSGGAGAMRGGQGLDYAWTPWSTPGGQEHVFAACWQVPPTGIAGGYPGSASGFVHVPGARADATLDRGKLPDSVHDFDAAAVPLDGKHVGIAVAGGDVISMRSGGGGGLGDPLDRLPASVAQDVADTAISAELADRVYGVVLAADSSVDQGATDARRAGLRQERTAWPLGVLPATPGEPDGRPARVRVRPLGEALAELGGWCQPRDGV
ncbi:MAG TPA: hydantoinase B/oxoprolinase family protein, partial [Sporichthya sp.]|nr:hydantoinase B/oxoprolinase family protein [Sporichthya sp.]